MEQWNDNVLGFLIAGAAAAGALVMKFGHFALPQKAQVDSECARQMLAELQEIRKIMHTNTRYMDDLRQEVSHLRTEMAETKGMLR